MNIRKTEKNKLPPISGIDNYENQQNQNNYQYQNNLQNNYQENGQSQFSNRPSNGYNGYNVYNGYTNTGNTNNAYKNLNYDYNTDIIERNERNERRQHITSGHSNKSHFSSRDLNSVNNNHNSLLNLDIINNELNNTKRALKSVLENQNELQSKVIEYNKIITEQENIIRLNNLKLNEHDSKLTEILITFNNYLQLNDKTTKIVNDLTNKSEEFVKKSELTDLKATVYKFNSGNEFKITETLNKLEDLEIKTIEISKEQEVFHKYTLEKLKTYQNEAMENRLQQQQQLIKHEESREIKINQQLDQLKGQIKIVEKNLVNEGNFRKNLIENSQQEIMQEIAKRDERIFTLEKHQLESEKKFMNINKEYITTFQELILKHNQKYEIEFKSIKSIIENGFLKVDSKFDEKIKQTDAEMTSIKLINNENKTNLKNFENYFRENVDVIESKQIKVESILNDLGNKHEYLSETLTKFLNENEFFVDEKINFKLNLSESKTSKLINEIIIGMQISENKQEKVNSDFAEKLENLNKTIAETVLFKNEKEANQVSSPIYATNVELVILEKKIEDKYEKFLKDFEEFEKKIIMLLNLHIDGIKKNINEEQRSLVINISDKLDSKVTSLKKDLEDKKNEEEIIKEGRIQAYVVESEERIKKIFNERIKILEENNSK